MRLNYLASLVLLFVVVGTGLLFNPAIGLVLLISAALAVVCTVNARG
jgi:hypothetical protein